jgi:hypothetical protein
MKHGKIRMKDRLICWGKEKDRRRERRKGGGNEGGWSEEEITRDK